MVDRQRCRGWNRIAAISYAFPWNKAWEIETEGKLCILGISNAISGPVKREAWGHGRPWLLVWHVTPFSSGTLRTGGLGIIWRCFLGLNIFILRKSQINPCSGVIFQNYCLCRKHWQWDWASGRGWWGWQRCSWACTCGLGDFSGGLEGQMNKWS